MRLLLYPPEGGNWEGKGREEEDEKIAKGMNVNVQDVRGRTPLLQATIARRLECMHLLLENPNTLINLSSHQSLKTPLMEGTV